MNRILFIVVIIIVIVLALFIWASLPKWDCSAGGGYWKTYWLTPFGIFTQNGCCCPGVCSNVTREMFINKSNEEQYEICDCCFIVF